VSDANGWRVFLTDDDQPAVFCPECAEREFGYREECEEMCGGGNGLPAPAVDRSPACYLRACFDRQGPGPR
jgi:hypothetical protein